MGGNAWRCAHNPPNPELLDATDRLGMLVWDENRVFGPTDSYDRPAPQEHALADVIADVQAMVLRDRNHPSVIWWSLCNEEGCNTSPGVTQPFAAAFATQVKYAVELYDSTRPITAGMNHLDNQGTSAALDVQGFNYNYNQLDAWHAAHPLVPVISSETAACTCARGVYVTNVTAEHVDQMHCVDAKCLGGTTLEEGWSFVADREWMHGGFYWSGFDYLGEPSPYAWPERNSNWGIHDLAGFRKDMYCRITSNQEIYDRTFLYEMDCL